MKTVTDNVQIQQTISQLKDIGLFDFAADGSLTQKEQEACFAEALADVEDIIFVEDGDISPFELFIKLPFNAARKQTENMSAKQRIEYLEKLDKRNVYLYELTRKYYDSMLTRDDQLRPKEFRSILGKIKHCEILQNWLYGIY